MPFLKRTKEYLTVALADNAASADLVAYLENLEEMIMIQQETITVGGRTLVVGPSTVLLNAEPNGPGPDRVAIWSKSGTPYQVPAGKKLMIKAISNIGGGGFPVYLGYADTAVSDNADYADLINPELLGGTEFSLYMVDANSGNNESNAGKIVPDFEIPAGKYPFVGSPSPAALLLFCELKDA